MTAGLMFGSILFKIGIAISVTATLIVLFIMAMEDGIRNCVKATISIFIGCIVANFCITLIWHMQIPLLSNILGGKIIVIVGLWISVMATAIVFLTTLTEYCKIKTILIATSVTLVICIVILSLILLLWQVIVTLFLWIVSRIIVALDGFKAGL